MVVDQLAELSLPIPEVLGSNSVIVKEKSKIKKMRPVIAHFLKTIFIIFACVMKDQFGFQTNINWNNRL